MTLVEKASDTAAKRNSGKAADVMLRYNFPGGGLSDDALRTLILMVLDNGRRDPSRADRLRPAQRRQSAQVPKISMVWLTSENPCSAATSAAHASTSWSPTSTVDPQPRHTRWW